MANEEHMELLEQGVEVWNKWRKEHPEIQPDLSKALIVGAALSGADLSQASLSGAILNMGFLGYANVTKADLSYANLTGTDLSYANLSGANLRNAHLRSVTLLATNLSGVNLGGTEVLAALLSRANLNHAKMWSTVLSDLDLRQVKGLETVMHGGPSFIDIQTIYKSHGEIPEDFLRGAGVPDSFIQYMHSLVGKPIDYYSAFISYSSKDEEFARRLYNDLQGTGVRCWFAPEDLKIGAKIRPSIDESIRLHDKLLLVLSRASVASQWVEQEVETALARERKEKRLVLFPVRLDQAVMKQDTGWPALLRNTRNIGDFVRWKDHDAYQKAFDRLLCDLKASSTSPN